jgi:hypothetical protein
LAKTSLCGVGGTFVTGASQAGVTSCNPDFAIEQAGIITRWTPVKNLTFSADLTWTRVDQKYSGIVSTLAPSGTTAKPVASYELKDQDTVTLLLRAQRNW